MTDSEIWILDVDERQAAEAGELKVIYAARAAAEAKAEAEADAKIQTEQARCCEAGARGDAHKGQARWVYEGAAEPVLWDHGRCWRDTADTNPRHKD